MSKKFIVGVVAITGLLLLGGGFLAVRMGQARPQLRSDGGQGKLKINQKLYDFGEVTLKGGNVVRVYEVENVGTGELSLANFVTSCDCTTVKLKTSQRESPAFGMHEQSSWQGKLGVGEKGEVEVVFDPDYHGPSGKGAITRIIKFETNDADNREVELMMTGKVI